MRRIATGVGIVALFVVVMLAASVQGVPTIEPPDFAQIDGETFDAPEPTGTPAPAPLPEPESDLVNTVISLIFLLVVIAGAVLIAVLVIRTLMRLWRERPVRARAGGDVDVERVLEAPETDAVAPAIRRGIAGALRSIAQGVTPADAIVAAWVGLEESAADAGTARGATETPAEFALRIITRRTGITDAATELLALYERVRFGGHVADEADRAAARAALRAIEEGWR